MSGTLKSRLSQAQSWGHRGSYERDSRLTSSLSKAMRVICRVVLGEMVRNQWRVKGGTEPERGVRAQVT